MRQGEYITQAWISEKWNMQDDIGQLKNNFLRYKPQWLELLATVDMAWRGTAPSKEISIANIKADPLRQRMDAKLKSLF